MQLTRRELSAIVEMSHIFKSIETVSTDYAKELQAQGYDVDSIDIQHQHIADMMDVFSEEEAVILSHQLLKNDIKASDYVRKSGHLETLRSMFVKDKSNSRKQGDTMT